MITFSFILPHKNTPELLQKALDSIPRWDDIEIIVADDNSDTATTDFAHFPGTNDPTVQVFFTKEKTCSIDLDTGNPLGGTTSFFRHLV